MYCHSLCNYLRNCQTCTAVFALFYSPTSSVWTSDWCTFLLTACHLTLLDYSHSSGYDMASYCGFDLCIFLITNNIKCLFMFFIGYFAYIFWDVSISFAHLKYCCMSFYHWIVYIISMQATFKIYDLKIFSYIL